MNRTILEQDQLLREALESFFDIDAEPKWVIVTAPAAVCERFYGFLCTQHRAVHCAVMIGDPMHLGEKIYFRGGSVEQILNWIREFGESLSSAELLKYYHSSAN